MKISDLVKNCRFTILLGKNGSGKSTHLRALDVSEDFNTNYISPERGGSLKYDPGIEQNVVNNELWMSQDRRKNRTESFRQQSAYQFRNLEMMVLREIEKDSSKRADKTYTFDSTISQINELLPAIKLERSDRGFKIFSRAGSAIDETQISSGEAELIALSIEVLVFARESKTNKALLLDEPDVHLHPDLQQKFIEFIEKVACDFDFKVVIATHSTAVIGAVSRRDDLQIIPITTKNQSVFKQFSYSPICHNILPVFGAHPLSAQFNKSPVILVEGEDDKRILDQVVRSSGGRFCYSPCVVGTVTEIGKWEAWLNDFLPSIYDGARAYSIRDLDKSPQTDIGDVGCVLRCRLNCYAMENLLLSDECLVEHGYNDDSFLGAMLEWTKERPDHSSSEEINSLAQNFDNRRTIKIKNARNVLVALLGSSKPWEVIVGQLIVKSILGPFGSPTSEHSVRQYLGDSVIKKSYSLNRTTTT